MYFKLLLLVGVVAASYADDVIQFGDDDFENKISDHETALVMFFAPWCGHCKRLKPEFEKAASLLKENDPPIALAKVDCTEAGKDTCGKYGVSGYPTLKIFRNGELTSDYNGPRDVNGIVKYMKAQVGPASKELKTKDAVESFLNKNEVGVVYFGGESSLKDAFMKVADMLRETMRFGHSLEEEVNTHYAYKEKIVLFRPKHLHNKFEDPQVIYDGDADKQSIETFIKDSFHGLVGHRTQDTAADFRPPFVVAYYNVDYVKNPKGTNYWRNRILKVAVNYATDFTFAVSSKDDFQHELNEFGLEFISGDKPVICARDKAMKKFVMSDEFTMDNFDVFLQQLQNEELEPYMKSEPVPESQEGSVTVAVAKNFDEVVTSEKDALVEFYAPWCGHCKKLAPTYEELAEKMKDEDVEIVKMDATANDVSSSYNVKGFPTLYWKPKGKAPVSYDGGRELDDFIKYIAKHATDELKGWDRKGKPKKTEL